MTPSDPSLKIPQIGWNTLTLNRPHPLFEGIPTTGNTACMPISSTPIISMRKHLMMCCNHGLWRAGDGLRGQGQQGWRAFHPEKSQKLGLALISNFLRWNP